jgi:hypothetical protein
MVNKMRGNARKVLDKLLKSFNKKIPFEDFKIMTEAWAEHIDFLTEDQIETAFNIIYASGMTFMPSIPQFLFMAHGFNSPEEAFYQAKKESNFENLSSILQETIMLMGKKLWDNGYWINQTHVDAFSAFKGAYLCCCSNKIKKYILEHKL